MRRGLVWFLLVTTRPLAILAVLCAGAATAPLPAAGAAGAEPQAPRLFARVGSHSVTSVAFSPDGRMVLVGSEDNTAHLWEAAGRGPRRLEGHSSDVTAVAFSPDGRLALTGSGDNSARLWDVATANEARRLQGHSDNVTAVAFSPDGQWVLTGSEDDSVQVWDDRQGTAAAARALRQRDGRGRLSRRTAGAYRERRRDGPPLGGGDRA